MNAKNMPLKIKEIIREHINSEQILEILKLIELYEQKSSIIQENKQNKKTKQSRLQELEDRLMSDVKLQVNDSLKYKIEMEIETLKKDLDVSNLDKNEDKNAEYLDKLDNKIQKRISAFLLEYNIDNPVLSKDFEKLCVEIKAKLEFEGYRSKASGKITILKDLKVDKTANIVVRALQKYEEKNNYLAKVGPYWKYVKYLVEDESGTFFLIMWNEHIVKLEYGEIYEIRNCVLEEHYDEKQIKILPYSTFSKINTTSQQT